MEEKYHTMDKGTEELLEVSGMIEDAAYIIADKSNNSMGYTVNQMGGNCKTCSCRSSASSSPCRASSLERKSSE